MAGLNVIAFDERQHHQLRGKGGMRVGFCRCSRKRTARVRRSLRYLPQFDCKRIGVEVQHGSKLPPPR